MHRNGRVLTLVAAANVLKVRCSRCAIPDTAPGSIQGLQLSLLTFLAVLLLAMSTTVTAQPEASRVACSSDPRETAAMVRDFQVEEMGKITEAKLDAAEVSLPYGNAFDFAAGYPGTGLERAVEDYMDLNDRAFACYERAVAALAPIYAYHVSARAGFRVPANTRPGIHFVWSDGSRVLLTYSTQGRSAEGWLFDAEAKRSRLQTAGGESVPATLAGLGVDQGGTTGSFDAGDEGGVESFRRYLSTLATADGCSVAETSCKKNADGRPACKATVSC